LFKNRFYSLDIDNPLSDGQRGEALSEGQSEYSSLQQFFGFESESDIEEEREDHTFDRSDNLGVRLDSMTLSEQDRKLMAFKKEIRGVEDRPWQDLSSSGLLAKTITKNHDDQRLAAWPSPREDEGEDTPVGFGPSAQNSL